MWNQHQKVKKVSRNSWQFLWIFCKEFSMHGGLNQQKGGAIINKTQKTQESSRPKASQPKPTDLMDPDQANALGALDWSRSIRILIKRSGLREHGPGMEQPGPGACIKGCLTRFCSFQPFHSLSSSLLLRFSLRNPNPLPCSYGPKFERKWLKRSKSCS